MTFVVVGFVGCDERSGSPEATCTAPQQIDKAALTFGPSLVLPGPRLEHTLVLEFPSDEAAFETNASIGEQMTRSPGLVKRLKETQPYTVPPYLLFDYQSSDQVRQRACRLLAALTFQVEPSLIAIVDVG